MCVPNGGRDMPEKGAWRSESAYEYVDDLDPAGLAWEFLRRNSEYREDFERLVDHGELSPSAAATLSDKWGLRFRLAPEHSCRGWSYLLDPYRKPGQRYLHGCAKCSPWPSE